MKPPHPIRQISVFVRALIEPKVRFLFGLTFSVIATGAVFFHYVEGWAWIDSFYFSTVTLATVGYGDFAPVTAAGKLFTMFYVVIGIGIFVALGAALADEVVLQSATERKETARALRRAEARKRAAERAGLAENDEDGHLGLGDAEARQAERRRDDRNRTGKT
ncbi:MAG: potassium channel family protein [Pseudomonadota bacterium]